MSGREIKLDPK